MTDQELDYLWDRSGTPDADVLRLEELLRPLGHAARLRRAPLPLQPRSVSSRLWSTARPLLAAAAALVLGLGAWFLSGGALAGWTVEQIAGSPQLDGVSLDGDALLRRGGQLVTDDQSRARIA